MDTEPIVCWGFVPGTFFLPDVKLSLKVNLFLPAEKAHPDYFD